MEEELFRQQLLAAYKELAPEAGTGGELLMSRLAKRLFNRGARIEIGTAVPHEKRHIHQSLDPDQRIVWVCKLWNQTMGYRSRAAVGRHISDILTPESFAFFLADWWPTVTEQGAAGPYEVTLVTAQGQPLPAKVKTERMRDRDGLFVRTFAKLTVMVPQGMDNLARAACLLCSTYALDRLVVMGLL